MFMPCVIFTANYRTHHNIFTGLRGRDQLKLLLTGPQQQVPALYFRTVTGAQQGEAMDRSVPIPRFCLVRQNAKQDRLANLQGDFQLAPDRRFIATIFIGHYLDYVQLILVCLSLTRNTWNRGGQYHPAQRSCPACHAG
jgi:hypothetical protein